MSSRPSVTAFVMTRNEEEMLPHCLKRLTWADEILVVDSHSTDQTRAIAESFGARVIERDFDGFGPTCNFGLEASSCDWVLQVDADELVTGGLRDSVQKIVTSPSPLDIYSLLRDSVVLGRRLKSSAWSGEWVPRLFRRGTLRFQGVVHQEPLIGERPVGRLDGVLVHYPYRSVAKYFNKSELYSTLWAEKALAGGRTSNMPKAVASGLWRVFHDYFIRGGIRDGSVGIFLALAGGMHTFTRHMKLWGMREATRLARVHEEVDE